MSWLYVVVLLLLSLVARSTQWPYSLWSSASHPQQQQQQQQQQPTVRNGLTRTDAVAAYATNNLLPRAPLENGFETRIVGGRVAKIKEFPHQVTLHSSDSPTEFICGGAILSDIWVLLSAHCITGNHPKLLIKAGKFNITATEATEQIVKVGRIFVHEHFNQPPTANDIALVKLVKGLKLNAYVKPIGLPLKGSNPTLSAIVSGWGSISKTTEHLFPQILQTATLTLLDYKTCEQVNKNLGRNFELYPSQICTSPGITGIHPCKGDSGGPLIQGKKIVGIVSFGPTPCFGHLPNIYTKVSFYIDWINAIMKHN